MASEKMFCVRMRASVPFDMQLHVCLLSVGLVASCLSKWSTGAIIHVGVTRTVRIADLISGKITFRVGIRPTF